MVSGIPYISVGTQYPKTTLVPDVTETWGVCIETIKGTPFVPMLVDSPETIEKEFKTSDLEPFFGVGGINLMVTRVTAGTPVAAVHTLLDRSATPVDAVELTAKSVGSYEIYITAALNINGGSNLFIEEEGYAPEYYIGIRTLADLVARINSNSQIVTATLVAEGSGTLGTVTRTQLGTGAGNTAGSDGTTKGGSTNGELAEADAPTAHRAGLKVFENVLIGGVFSISQYDTVQDEYIQHSNYMNMDDINKWRYAVVGVDGSADKTEILERAAGIDSENVMLVGQGLVDRNEVEYPPYMCTMAVAGKRSQMDYRTPIWGGQAIKRLGVDGSNYFVVPMTLPGVNSKADLINYNEHGVITFVEGVDGMRIREAVLTTQPGNTEQESEEAIVSILHMVKVNVWEVAKEFQGRTITASYKTDLEQNISSRLDQMKQDDALVDISEEDLKAYDVQVTVLPRSNQIKGIVTIKVTVTPVHAARQIVATIYVN